MASVGGLQSVYVALFLLASIISATVAVWVHLSVEDDGRQTFVTLMLVDSLWALSAAIELSLPASALKFLFLHVRIGWSILAVFMLGVFVTEYTGRSMQLSRPRNAGFVAWAVGSLLSLATNPLHGLYLTWTLHETPFPYYETHLGPLGIPTNVVAFLALGVGVYYLSELFIRTRHRGSRSLLVLAGATGLAIVPNALSRLGQTPLDGYNHTALGVVFFSVGTTYAVFKLGMFDVAPMARDVLVDQVDDALVVLDDHRCIVDYNVTGGELFPSLDDDAIGDPLADVAPTLASAVTFPDGPDADQATEELSLQRDGEEHYSVLVTPLVERDVVVGYSVVLRTVTDLVEYRRELERQNDQLDAFASTVSHDLRNPLQVALGHGEYLARELEQDPYEQSAEEVVDALDRMEHIISDLLTIAKHGQTVEETSQVQFSTAVEEAWVTVETGAASRVVAADGSIRAERSRLLTILENLVRNAVEHGSNGSGEEGVRVEFGLTADGFYVADDGPGVPPDVRDSIFESGFTTAEEGTGLGLNIVRTMAQSHGWRIALDTEYDDGARFVVSGCETDLDAA